MTEEPCGGYSKTNTSSDNVEQKEEIGTEFVDGWTLARTLGEGAFGE
jgi:hypothetical protein